jgi:hypothetical protein
MLEGERLFTRTAKKLPFSLFTIALLSVFRQPTAICGKNASLVKYSFMHHPSPQKLNQGESKT